METTGLRWVIVLISHTEQMDAANRHHFVTSPLLFNSISVILSLCLGSVFGACVCLGRIINIQRLELESNGPKGQKRNGLFPLSLSQRTDQCQGEKCLVHELVLYLSFYWCGSAWRMYSCTWNIERLFSLLFTSIKEFFGQVIWTVVNQYHILSWSC